MAQSGDTGVTMYAGLAIVLLIALGALALFKFNLFNVGDMLGNSGDDRRAPIIRNPSDDGGIATDGTTPDGAEPWSDVMPEASKYYVSHTEPLPNSLTARYRVGEEADGPLIEIEMQLVPQGWFMMGENDGVVSNMPKRWIWLDDYYIARDEMTNSQFYGFILADGYRKSQYWTQEGYRFISNQPRNRGTTYIGWLPLDRDRRMSALASPRSDKDEVVTLEVLDTEGLLGMADCTVLVLPGNGSWVDYLDYDLVGDQWQVRLKYRDQWKDVDGEDVLAHTDHDMRKAGYLYTTDREGRIDLSNIRTGTSYRVLAWANGDKASPILGKLKRSRSPYMRDGNMPVVELNWFEANACCTYFEGTLPTEAQWEKAGRGAKGKLFPWGDELGMDLLEPDRNGTMRYTTQHANLNRWFLKPVGSYPSGNSEYGVRDMVGNVSEWCRDVYINNPTWDERNPLGKGQAQNQRSERGSNTHDDDPQTAKLHNRRYGDPYKREVDTRGFRLVMTPEQALKASKVE